MREITYKTFNSGDIGHLKNLCNGLMKFQGDHASIKKEVMQSMTFDNRFVPEYNSIDRKQIVVAYDNDLPVGFAYGAVSVEDESKGNEKPPWASDLGGLGFYPQEYDLPKVVGVFKLLFVEPDYRGFNIGVTLCNSTMSWLRAQEDVEDLWVYVANGNEKVGALYEKLGFKHSHQVWNGFIEAYYQKK